MSKKNQQKNMPVQQNEDEGGLLFFYGIWLRTFIKLPVAFLWWCVLFFIIWSKTLRRATDGISMAIFKWVQEQ